MSEVLNALLAEVSIAHHIPGRVRLKLAGVPAPLRTQFSPDMLARFFSGLAEIPGILQVKLNALAKSCTLEYDTNTIAESAWHELFSANAAATPSSHAQGLLEGVRQSYRNVVSNKT
ncbi:hypothetical protein AGMMS49545_01270 [Betaproteobacteria bacterium]|nr:hypothetical protein AGMMS49545_01270 [Betaproteobacteria bacterium]